MDKKEYEIMFRLEDNHWWYRGLRALVSRLIEKAGIEKKPGILDAGCGTGGMLRSLRDPSALGFDFSEEALKFCQRRGLDNLVRASVCEIPFSGGSFDTVVSLDVLYHKEVGDDLRALVEFNRVLRNGGLLILNLPAFEFLRSTHDEAVHTRRRYTRDELRKKLEKSGFRTEIISYRNTILFPAIAALRLVEKFFSRFKRKSGSDLKALPSSLNSILTSILLFENMLIQYGFSLPFGLSLFCAARKQ